MNIARTQYVENNFERYQSGYQIFLSWFFAEKRFFILIKTILQSGLIPIISCVVIMASIIGYVAAINYSMVRGVLLKQEQKAIKLIETSVLQKETVLANIKTIASLKKQNDIALMENVERVSYVSSNASVADASEYQTTR